MFIAAWPPSFLSLPSTKSSIYVSSLNKAFPAEACATVGGVACDVDMFPETKIKKQLNSKRDSPTPQPIDREYLEYNNPKTQVTL